MAENLRADGAQTVGGFDEPLPGSKRAGYAISQMAGLASAVRDLCSDLIFDSDASWGNDVINKIVAARELCSQIGALADIANVDLGNRAMCHHNDARGWLCPPAYHDQDKEPTGA
jgi:hypothetical protein